MDLAMQLQIDLENHLMMNVPLYGASLDIHKAFNTLSRPLLERMCSRLGLTQVWAPYSAACMAWRDSLPCVKLGPRRFSATLEFQRVVRFQWS